MYAALAMALAAAIAPNGTTEHFFTITFQEGRAAAGRGGQIEVEGFMWGPRQSAGINKIDSFTVKQKVKPVASGGGANEISMDDSAGKESASGMDAGMKRLEAQDRQGDMAVGSNETLTVGTARTESGQATGKRQHRPMILRGYYDTSAPPPAGSLRVKVKMPWLACEEGRKYPSLTLAKGGRRYVLQDVTVAGCGGTSADADDRPTEEIAFYYNKISF